MLDCGIYEFVNRREAALRYLRYSRFQKKRKRKQALITAFVLSAFVFFVICTVWTFANDSHYREAKGKVYKHGIEIVTDDGNIWELNQALTRELGASVTVIFDTKGTQTLIDDEIVSIRDIRETGN